jgi:hypothetical protein
MENFGEKRSSYGSESLFQKFDSSGKELVFKLFDREYFLYGNKILEDLDAHQLYEKISNECQRYFDKLNLRKTH